jgi:hypothetical protein
VPCSTIRPTSLQGDGRYLRKIPFDEAAAEPDAVMAIVRSAISNQTRM